MFAIEAVVDIAYNSGEHPVQSKDIAERQGIPRRYLEQVLQQLVRADILRGVRGPRGGYRLARERRRIPLGEIVRIVAGMNADEEDEDTGSELGRCGVAAAMAGPSGRSAGQAGRGQRRGSVQTARKAGIDSTARKSADFNI